MKKLLALLLAVAMLLTLVACGKKDTNDTTDTPAMDFTGTWTVTFNLNALLNIGAMGDVNDLLQMMGTQDLDLKMTTDFTFQEGQLTVDPTGYTDFFTKLFTAVENWLDTADGAAAFDAYCVQNNLDKDESLQKITADNLPALMANELVSKMKDSSYAVEGDKLYLWNPSAEKNPNNYYRFTYTEDTITILEVAEGGQSTQLNAGDFVFTKK